jgi:hypothetical protein
MNRQTARPLPSYLLHRGDDRPSPELMVRVNIADAFGHMGVRH